MTDIVERLRTNARSEDCLYDMDPELLNAAADENERLRADLDTEKERSQELGRDKENWYRICEIHATRLDSYQKAMRQAMSMLDQAEPRPEAAFSALLLALNPDLESAKNLATKEDV